MIDIVTMTTNMMLNHFDSDSNKWWVCKCLIGRSWKLNNRLITVTFVRCVSVGHCYPQQH